jgi:membrane protein YdbS with pleckstrin-like domain
VSDSPQQAAEWLYHGIWQVLVKWFVVPRQPPDLPVRPGETIQRLHPSPGFLSYLKLQFWIGVIVKDVWFLIGWIASFVINPWLGAALTPVFFLVAILPDLLAYVAIHLRYDSTWYVLSDRSLRIRRGIWTIHETTVTFENVQDVTIRQGPLQRHYGIANVIVETAGGGGGKKKGEGAGVPSHTGLIEGVEDAARIRDLIMTRVRRSRAAGLGDEAHEHEKASHPAGPGWTAEHVAVLREIRDGLRGALPHGSSDLPHGPRI